CCFSTTSFYIYLSIIPVLGIIVMGISYKIYGYYSKIIMLESLLLDRKVKKLAAKVEKSSNSDHEKAPIPIPNNPLLNDDSAKKNHMGDPIPIHLVHGSDGAAAPSSAATTAPLSDPALIPVVAAAPASAGAPATDPHSEDDVTEMSGYSTAPFSDHVNVSPQDTRPKLPDMSELPSISTMDTGTDAGATTRSLSEEREISSNKSLLQAPVSIPGRKDDDRTEILSPDVSNTSDLTNDPFQTYAVPRHMLRDLRRAESDVTTGPGTIPSKTTVHEQSISIDNRHLQPPRRLEDVAVYTPPEHSPVTALRPAEKPAPAPVPVATRQSPEPAVPRGRPSYQRFADPDPTDPIFTPPQERRYERRQQRPTHQSSNAGRDADRQYAKPTGYFAQRAKAWLADNRDSDSAEEK
ncbi:hypothetical protein PENTCL1PPCAC_5763, partial [Pristionchus entomophagus]